MCFGVVVVVFGEFVFEFGCVYVVVVGGFWVCVDCVMFGYCGLYFGVVYYYDVEYVYVFVCKLVLV